MNDVELGKEGEMLVRGPTIFRLEFTLPVFYCEKCSRSFRRYMNDPKSTKEAFHDGWMRTGDVLKADEEGFFYLTDRKYVLNDLQEANANIFCRKELIKYKGYVLVNRS